MTQMTMNPLMVGLVQAAAALPVFLVILPAGAVAKRNRARPTVVLRLPI